MTPDSEWRQGEGIVELASRLLRERDEARAAHSRTLSALNKSGALLDEIGQWAKGDTEAQQTFRRIFGSRIWEPVPEETGEEGRDR